MPLYSLSSKETIKEEEKLKLVNAITDIHCGLTGAPEQFVHVIFSDGIPITSGKKLYLQLNVRAGRNETLIKEMKRQLTMQSAQILKVYPDSILINLLEIEASWVMEGGFVMPEPGEEEEWMEKVELALSKRNELNATMKKKNKTFYNNNSE